jgi:hypothetical protein
MYPSAWSSRRKSRVSASSASSASPGVPDHDPLLVLQPPQLLPCHALGAHFVNSQHQQSVGVPYGIALKEKQIMLLLHSEDRFEQSRFLLPLGTQVSRSESRRFLLLKAVLMPITTKAFWGGLAAKADWIPHQKNKLRISPCWSSCAILERIFFMVQD